MRNTTKVFSGTVKELQEERALALAHVKTRLEYLRSQIENECISYWEIAELQSLAKYIEPGDVVLLEWAGVPEMPEEKQGIDCPLCGIFVAYQLKEGVHMWVCGECPFVGKEIY